MRRRTARRKRGAWNTRWEGAGANLARVFLRSPPGRAIGAAADAPSESETPRRPFGRAAEGVVSASPLERAFSSVRARPRRQRVRFHSRAYARVCGGGVEEKRSSWKNTPLDPPIASKIAQPTPTTKQHTMQATHQTTHARACERARLSVEFGPNPPKSPARSANATTTANPLNTPLTRSPRPAASQRSGARPQRDPSSPTGRRTVQFVASSSSSSLGSPAQQ